jgi:hypothetical protein
MKKTVPLFLVLALLLAPGLAKADLPSDTCFPSVQCDSGEDFYGGSNCPLGAPSCCQPHVETLTGSSDSCQSINNTTPPSGKEWAFSCDRGCYLKNIPVAPACGTSNVNTGSTLPCCANGQIAVRDSSVSSGWKCQDQPVQSSAGNTTVINNENVTIEGDTIVQGDTTTIQTTSTTIEGDTVTIGGDTITIQGDNLTINDIIQGDQVCLGGNCYNDWTDMITNEYSSPSPWSVNGSNVYRSTGDVGIRTPTPGATLHVAAPNMANDKFALKVQIAGSNKLAVWGNGGVAVGTNDSPSANGLTVGGNIKFGTQGHYLDANDDHWARLMDGDDGSYTDLAVGKLFVDGKIQGSDGVEILGDLILGDYDIKGIDKFVFNDGVELYGDGNDSNLNFKHYDDGGGGIKFRSGDAYDGAVYGNGDGQNFGLLDSDSNWAVQIDKDDFISFKVNNSEKMKVLSDGDVEIPSGDITVTGQGNFQDLYLSGGSGNPDIEWFGGYNGVAGKDLRFRTAHGPNTYTRMYIEGDTGDLRVDDNTLAVDVSKNAVGIGDSSPNATLHVAAPSSPPDGYAFRVQIDGSTKLSTWSNGGTSIGGNTTPPFNGLYVNGDVKFNNDLELENIQADKINADTLYLTGYNPNVIDADNRALEFDRDVENEIVYHTDADFSYPLPAYKSYTVTNHPTKGEFSIWEQCNGCNTNYGLSNYLVPRFVIREGNVGIGDSTPDYKLDVAGTAYSSGAAGALSDIRHKKNITPLDVNALKLVSDLKPVYYEWKEPEDAGMEGVQIGFIAQDMEKILPQVVLTQDDEEQTKGIKYSEIIPVLTKAIQQQQDIISSLEERIVLLEGKN